VKVSKQAKREAKELFRTCVVNGGLDGQRVRQVVQRVVAAKPRGYLAILSHFHRLVKLDIVRRTARVESPSPLTGAMEGAIRTSLERKYGRDLNVAFAQNPALLGGLRIRVGSDVYDGSIQSRLSALEESF
jgi:F-type H+-transporting ATPase subunit delta